MSCIKAIVYNPCSLVVHRLVEVLNVMGEHRASIVVLPGSRLFLVDKTRRFDIIDHEHYFVLSFGSLRTESSFASGVPIAFAKKHIHDQRRA